MSLLQAECPYPINRKVILSVVKNDEIPRSTCQNLDLELDHVLIMQDMVAAHHLTVVDAEAPHAS